MATGAGAGTERKRNLAPKTVMKMYWRSSFKYLDTKDRAEIRMIAGATIVEAEPEIKSF